MNLKETYITDQYRVVIKSAYVVQIERFDRDENAWIMQASSFARTMDEALAEHERQTARENKCQSRGREKS